MCCMQSFNCFLGKIKPNFILRLEKIHNINFIKSKFEIQCHIYNIG